MPETTVTISFDGIDANNQLVGWATLDSRGAWTVNAEGETWVEHSREGAEEALRRLGAVRFTPGFQ